MSNVSAPIVFVVDSDPSVRESLELLVRAAGLAGGGIWIRAGIPRASAACCSFSCLILDVTSP